MTLALCSMSHSPLLELSQPPAELAADVETAFAAARTFISGYDPELVVVFGPDHYNGFFYELMPQFCIGMAATSIGDFGCSPGPLDVPRDIAEGLAQDVDPQSHLFLRLRVMHPMLATLVGAWLVFFAVTAPASTRQFGRAVLLLFVVQAGVGVATWLLLAPVWLQLVHLLVADLLWVTIVLLCANLGKKPVDA